MIKKKSQEKKTFFTKIKKEKKKKNSIWRQQKVKILGWHLIVKTKFGGKKKFFFHFKVSQKFPEK